MSPGQQIGSTSVTRKQMDIYIQDVWKILSQNPKSYITVWMYAEMTSWIKRISSMAGQCHLRIDLVTSTYIASGNCVASLSLQQILTYCAAACVMDPLIFVFANLKTLVAQVRPKEVFLFCLNSET